MVLDRIYYLFNRVDKKSKDYSNSPEIKLKIRIHIDHKLRLRTGLDEGHEKTDNSDKH